MPKQYVAPLSIAVALVLLAAYCLLAVGRGSAETKRNVFKAPGWWPTSNAKALRAEIARYIEKAEPKKFEGKVSTAEYDQRTKDRIRKKLESDLRTAERMQKEIKSLFPNEEELIRTRDMLQAIEDLGDDLHDCIRDGRASQASGRYRLLQDAWEEFCKHVVPKLSKRRTAPTSPPTAPAAGR